MNVIGSALGALERAGIPYSFRRSPPVLDPPAGGEVDLAMRPADVRRADPLLLAAGLRRLDAPGHRGHRFYVMAEEGRWHKLDIKTARPRRTVRDADGRARRWVRAAARRRPAAVRRLGPIVAILGPDGAGKGTIISELAPRIPIGLTVIYLGTGRSAGSGGASRSQPDGARPARPAGPVRESAFLLRKALRSWWRLLRGYAAAWRGHIVLCDRHPVEMLAIVPQRTRTGAALERFLTRRLTPQPDAIVVLDAPAEVLHNRKQEHPIATLERWRTGYATAFGSRGAVIVPTTGSLEDAVLRVSDVVWQALRRRRGW